MDEDEHYRFDVFGFIVLPGVLSAAEVSTCNEAIDQIVSDGVDLLPATCDSLLRDHPVLVDYAESLCGRGFRLDTGPVLLEAGDRADGRLTGGGEWRDWSRAYFHRNGDRHCQGLMAVWALCDVGASDGGLVVIPASHNSEVETPEEVLSGRDDMDLLRQPVLQAGDLLLCADAVVRGMQPWQGADRSRLLSYSFVNKHVRPHDWSNLDPDDAYSWAADLPPAERAVLHNPQRKGQPAVVHVEEGTSHACPESTIYHPSIYVRDPDTTIDEKEFYHWDLCGHLLVKGAMDPEWLNAANEAVAANEDRIVSESRDGDKPSVRLDGANRSKIAEVWSLPDPHCEPFRRMIAHPEVVSRLNWMMGSGYEATKCDAFCSKPGAAGIHLHAGGTTQSELNHYTFRNGRCYCEYVNVAWQLRDVTAADGGFCYIPGSHKTAYPMPAGILSADDDMGMVKHLEMEAGDLLIFLAGAQTHGALPWTAGEDRRCVLLQYRSRNLSWESDTARKR